MEPSPTSQLGLSQEVLLSLSRAHLEGLPGVFVWPEVPERKARRAREAHAPHLGEGEAIVALFDATMLGSGENGFVATRAHFCWKNLMEHPRSVAWEELARTPVHALERHVEIARGQVQAPWVKEGPARVRDFLLACGRRTIAAAAPYRDVARDRGPQTFADRVVDCARRALGELDWVHYRPSIPGKMLATVRLIHERHLGRDEEILVLYDDTVLGSGSDGLVLTERGVCWRNFWSSAERIAWSEIAPEKMAVDGDLIGLEGDVSERARSRIDLRMRPGMARIVAGVLEEIATVVRTQREGAGLVR